MKGKRMRGRNGLAGAALVSMLVLAAATLAKAQGLPEDQAKLAAGFLAHKAVYDLTLAPGADPDKSPVQAGRARLLYEFRGNSCEGWSTTTRLVTELTPQEGRPQISDIRSSTFENLASHEFRFLTNTTVDGAVREEADGTASQNKNGELTINLKKPAARKVTPGGTVLFPTQHLIFLLNAAKSGEKIAEADLFDGSENGDKIYATTTVIGRGKVTALPAGDPAALPELKGLPRWPLTVSFFDRSVKGGGEQTPIYELSTDVYENGITQTMSLNYSNFSMKGKLISLELLKQAPCK